MMPHERRYPRSTHYERLHDIAAKRGGQVGIDVGPKVITPDGEVYRPMTALVVGVGHGAYLRESLAGGIDNAAERLAGRLELWRT